MTDSDIGSWCMRHVRYPSKASLWSRHDRVYRPNLLLVRVYVMTFSVARMENRPNRQWSHPRRRAIGTDRLAYCWPGNNSPICSTTCYQRCGRISKGSVLEIETWPSQTNDTQKWYLSLPTMVFHITRIVQCLISSVSNDWLPQLSGISGNEAGWPGLRVGQRYKVTMSAHCHNFAIVW